MTVLQSYSHIAFTCMVRSLEQTRLEVRNQLLRPDRITPVVETEGEVDLGEIYLEAPLPGGRHPAKALFFAPRIAPQVTVMFANYADGWQTLSACISKRIPEPIYRFALSADEHDWPMYLFEIWEGGVQRRHVSVIKDVDRWKFWQTGEPLPEEDVAVYKKRRIRDRLTRQYLVSLAERLGFPVGDDRFWQSDSKAVYFEEQRTAEPQSPPARSR